MSRAKEQVFGDTKVRKAIHRKPKLPRYTNKSLGEKAFVVIALILLQITLPM